MQASEVLDPRAVIACVMVPYCPPFPTDRHPLGGVVRLTARRSTPGIVVLGKASTTRTRHSIADANLERENVMASKLPLLGCQENLGDYGIQGYIIGVSVVECSHV